MRAACKVATLLKLTILRQKTPSLGSVVKVWKRLRRRGRDLDLIG